MNHRLKGCTWLLMLSLLLCTACARQPEPSAPNMHTQDSKLALMTSLSTSHHKRADLALQQNKRKEAFAELNTLLDQIEKHLPAQAAGHKREIADSYDLVFDASGRLARMHLEDKQLPQAEASARRGIGHAAQAPNTLFKGHLYQILGDILEAKEDPKGAVQAHGEAIEIFRSLLDKTQTPTSATKEAKP